MAEDLTHTAGALGDTAAETSAPPINPPGYALIDEVGRGGMIAKRAGLKGVVRRKPGARSSENA